MSTIRQKRLAKGIVAAIEKGETLSAGKVAKNSGYGKNIQEHPKAAIQSQGVQEELRNYGLDEGLIQRCLTADIEAKAGNRLGELRLGAEILRMTEGGSSAKVLVIQVAEAMRNKYDTDTGARSDTP